MKKFTHASHYQLNTAGFQITDLFGVGAFATACAILWTIDEETEAETPDAYAEELCDAKFGDIIKRATDAVEAYLGKPDTEAGEQEDADSAPLAGKSESVNGSSKPEGPPPSSGG
ncbi:hypothetical protein [Cerasicoccus frondis]|uniref:hypothetical protein n=1 Tax=Cerasicoccus frondis TaxID=490090 RepID=UPI0028527E01|nr:hypothetical protein [Cerasicoccus frondis]